MSLQLQSMRHGLGLQLQWCWVHIQEWPSYRLRSRLVLGWKWGSAPPSMSQQLLGHRESKFSLIQQWPRPLRQGLRPQLPWGLTQWQHSPRHVILTRQGLGQKQGLGQGQGLIRSRQAPAQAAALFLFP